jgi:hypothetical protein
VKSSEVVLARPADPWNQFLGLRQAEETFAKSVMKEHKLGEPRAVATGSKIIQVQVISRVA